MRLVRTRPILRVLPSTWLIEIDEPGSTVSPNERESLDEMTLIVLPVSIKALTGKLLSRAVRFTN